ncbi:unnamed protein product [Mucor fragilis]
MDQQLLFYQNKALKQDAHSLQDEAIPPNSLLLLKIDLKVYLHLADSKMCSFVIDPDETLDALKQKIQDELKIPIEKQRIVHRGIDMAGDFPLSYYVYDGNTYNIIIKLRGY